MGEEEIDGRDSKQEGMHFHDPKFIYLSGSKEAKAKVEERSDDGTLLVNKFNKGLC